MTDMLHIASLQLAGVLAIVVVLIAGAIGMALKGHAALSLSPMVAGFVSMPVAIVGAVGTVIALVVDPTVVGAAIVTVIIALTAGVVAILSKLGENKKAAREDAANLAIELAKISRSVDGVASKQVDKVATLEDRITDLLAQLADAKNIASTLAAVHASVAVVGAGNTARVKADVQDLKDQS